MLRSASLFLCRKGNPEVDLIMESIYVKIIYVQGIA